MTAPAVTHLMVADRDLLCGIARGDRAALLRLRARYEVTAYAVACAELHDPDAADSVVAGVLANVPFLAHWLADTGLPLRRWLLDQVKVAARAVRNRARA